MVEIKDSKVLLPVVGPRAEASQMWLFQFPRYILPRHLSISHEHFPDLNEANRLPSKFR